MNFILAGYIFCCLQMASFLSLISKNIYILLISFLVAFFSIFLILPDYYSYSEIFQRSPYLTDLIFDPFSSFITMGVEPGYVILNSLFKFIGLSYDSLRFFVILFVMFVKLYIMSKISNSFMISATAYLSLILFMDLFILRQSISSTFVAISIFYMFHGKTAKASIYICIASLFHLIALLAIPMLFIYKYKFKSYLYVTIIILAMFVGFFGLGSIITNLAVSLLGDTSFIADKLLRYSLGERAEATGIFRFSTLLILAVTLFVIIFTPRKKLTNQYYVILNLSMYALLILVLFNDFGILGDRGYRVVSFPLLIYFGCFVNSFRAKQRFFITATLTLFFLIVSFILINPDYIRWGV